MFIFLFRTKEVNWGSRLGREREERERERGERENETGDVGGGFNKIVSKVKK